MTKHSVVGWAGALGLGEGVNIVAGTGAIAYGEDCFGNKMRSNGWNSDFSDEGSCNWLGKKTIEIFCKQADNRLEKSNLYDILKEKLSLDSDFDIIEYYNSNCKNNRKELAKLQLYLFQAAQKGDQSAIEAYDYAARELVMSILAVKKKLQIIGTVAISYTGGLFLAGEMILEPLRKYLDHFIKAYRLLKALYVPEQGAILLAARYSGIDTEIIKRNLFTN